MDKVDAPAVAVIGGLAQLDRSQATAAKEVAKLIGSELAKAGFCLVVYFSNDDSLEPHVVTGYAAALAGSTGSAGRIRVRYAESQRGHVRFNEQATQPELFEYQLFPGQDWEAPFYRSLTEEEGIDAVLLLGGATSTLIAGQIALARRVPILAVDEFGGAASKIWNQLAQASPSRNNASWGTRPALAFIQQLKTECQAVTKQRSEARLREHLYASLIGQRRLTNYTAGAFFALLGALFLGMVYIPYPPGYPFVVFFGLIAAGAMGALVRAILSGSRQRDPRTSLLLGAIAGFVVGLAYLIPQWVGASDVLEATVTVVSAKAKIQFASAILVAISAGIGFDTVFNRLQKQADDVPVGPDTLK
jgi:hypothetical protein